MHRPSSEDKTPLVSVIMPNFNGAQWIEHSIRSVIDQTYPNWELIVVDDGSTDNSIEIIKGFSDCDDRISLQASPDNSGNPGIPRNTALRMVQGQYVAFLDSDDFWHPAKLIKQVSLMAASGPETALCHHGVAISVIGGGYRDGTNFSHARLRRMVEGRCFEALLMKNFISTSSVMLRRDALLEQQCWFDPNYRICHDWDLWLRIAWQYGIVHIPEVLGTYRIHGGNITANVRMLRKEEKAVVRKWRGKVPTGIYTKALAVRYVFDLYGMVPCPIRAVMKRTLPWPR